MKKKILSFALALFILIAVIPLGAPVLAATPANPSFPVNYEVEVGNEGTLLFSQAPTQVLTGDQYWHQTAYVFPAGTKVAQKMDGTLALIGAASESQLKEGYVIRYLDDAYEITLSSEMSRDSIGVRIYGSNVGRGLVTVVVSDSSAVSPSFEVKFSLANLHNGEYGVMRFQKNRWKKSVSFQEILKPVPMCSRWELKSPMLLRER